MPKATVKMAQTQPMIAAVPAMPKTAEKMVAAADEPKGFDTVLFILSLVATATSGAAAWFCYQAFSVINGF